MAYKWVVSSLAVPASIPLRMSTGQKSKTNISTGVWGGCPHIKNNS